MTDENKLRNVVELASEDKLSIDSPVLSVNEEAAAHGSPGLDSSLLASVAGGQTLYKSPSII